MANLGDINVGLGVDSGSFTSGIAKALQDLAQFAKGFKEVGIQGIEPLLKNLQAFSKATKDSFSETAKGKKIMEDLISLENTLVSLSSKVTSSEGQRTTAVDKGNRALEARQKLLQKIAEQDKLAKGQAISGGLNLLPDLTAPANIPATAWSDYGKLNEKLNRNFLTSVNESFGTGKTSVLESFSAVGKEATRFSTLLENMKNTNAFKSISKDVDLLSQEIEKAVLKAQGLTEKGNIGAARAVLTGAQGKVAAVQDTVNLQTYQQLRIATDGLAEANSKLGNSRLELQQKSENLRTSQGNLYAMAKTGKGDIAALSDEHGKLGVQLKETEKAMGKFQAAGHRTGMTIQSLIEWQMEWYLTQNILFGATGIIGQGIKNMVEFEQKMANLKAITNSTTADTELMGKAARQLGMNSRLGALEIADGMTIIGQAGFSDKEKIHYWA